MGPLLDFETTLPSVIEKIVRERNPARQSAFVLILCGEVITASPGCRCSRRGLAVATLGSGPVSKTR